MHWFALWLLSALSFVVTAWLVPGLKLESFGSALIAAAVMGVVNVLVRPLLLLLTLPVTVLTLGLFLFVVNALCLMLVSALTPGFWVKGFWWAVLGAVVLSVVSSLMHWIAMSL